MMAIIKCSNCGRIHQYPLPIGLEDSCCEKCEEWNAEEVIGMILENQEAAKGLPERCPSCGTPTKINDYCTNCAFDNQEAANQVEPKARQTSPLGRRGGEK
jgi:transposase